MTAISSLTQSSSLSAADQLFVYASGTGVDSRLSLSVLLSYLQDELGVKSMVTQYEAPQATGFNVTPLPGSDGLAQNTWMIITPAAGYAAGTLTLPIVSTLSDGQEILVNCTQAVTTFTIALNGATAVRGAPTTLAANATFRLKYDLISKIWYSVT